MPFCCLIIPYYSCFWSFLFQFHLFFRVSDFSNVDHFVRTTTTNWSSEIKTTVHFGGGTASTFQVKLNTLRTYRTLLDLFWNRYWYFDHRSSMISVDQLLLVNLSSIFCPCFEIWTSNSEFSGISTGRVFTRPLITWCHSTGGTLVPSFFPLG